MSDDEIFDHTEEDSLNLSLWGKLKEFFNRYIQVKWVLPPFLLLGFVSSLALQGVVNLSADRDHAAAVKTYEQCQLSHIAGLANKALQQSTVDNSRLIVTAINDILVTIAGGPLAQSANPRAQHVAQQLDTLDGQIDESQAKVDEIKVRDCTGLKPAGYTPSDDG